VLIAEGYRVIGIPEAIRLAEALGRAPRRLVVFAVEAADLGFGLGLSPAVAASMPELTRAVHAEVGAHRG
jgi:hydrogenase maturation protease